MAPAVNRNHHAQAYTGNRPPPLLNGERQLTLDPIKIILDDGILDLHKASRICFSRVYTVEHNVPVCGIGQVANSDFPKVQAYTLRSLQPQINPPGISSGGVSDDDDDDGDDDADEGNAANYPSAQPEEDSDAEDDDDDDDEDDTGYNGRRSHYQRRPSYAMNPYNSQQRRRHGS
jgi:hypothetical protein